MAKWGESMVESTALMGGRAAKLPFMKALGLDATLGLLSVGDGETVFEWTASEHLVSMDGIIQGGVLSVVADICQGHTYMSHLDAFHGFSTSDLQTRFIRPIRAGERMEVSSRITMQDARLTLISTAFTDRDNIVRAAAQGGWKGAKRTFAKTD